MDSYLSRYVPTSNMTQTAALALIAVSVVGMVLLTVAGIHYMRDVLSEPEDHDDDHGGAAL